MREKIFIKSRLLVVLLFFVLLNCSHRETESEEKSSISLEIEESKLIFDHKEYFISNYSIFFKSVGQDSLVLYEGQNRNDFFLFDTKNSNISKILEFESTGPNFLDDKVIDLETYANGYVILSYDYLQFSDLNGKIQKRIRINNLLNPAAYKVIGIKLISTDSLLMAKKIRSSAMPDIIDKPRQAIFAYLDLKTDSISDLNIFSPNETLVQDAERGYYSNVSDHYFLLNDDQLIFNYTFSPSIYQVNLKTLKVNQFSGSSELFPVKREPYPSKNYSDLASLLDYVNTGIYFTEMVFDEKNQLYFRVVKSSIKNEEGGIDYSNYLQIFDHEFNLLKEIKLKEMMKLVPGFSKGSIYLVPLLKYQDSENETRILKYTISKEKK